MHNNRSSIMYPGNMFRIGDLVKTVHPRFPEKYPTFGQIIGFSLVIRGRGEELHKPGIYQNTNRVIIRSIEKDQYDWVTSISTRFLRFIFTENFNPSLEERKLHPKSDFIWVQELPSVPFWEGDIVRVVNQDKFNKIIPVGTIAIVKHIYYKWSQYNNHNAENYGDVYPFFEVKIIGPSPYSNTLISLQKESLVLQERGPFWNYYHGIDYNFVTLQDEVRFHEQIGLTENIFNPERGDYAWSYREAQKAIKDGIGDYMFSPMHHTPPKDISKLTVFLNKFKSLPELRKRLRQVAPSGFILYLDR